MRCSSMGGFSKLKSTVRTVFSEFFKIPGMAKVPVVEQEKTCQLIAAELYVYVII